MSIVEMDVSKLKERIRPFRSGISTKRWGIYFSGPLAFFFDLQRISDDMIPNFEIETINREDGKKSVSITFISIEKR